LLIGRPIQFKNYKRIKDAFSLAKEENKNISLEVITDVAQDYLFEKISKCYAILSISIGEISPNLIMESITFNKPFILTKENGISKRVGDIAIIANPLSIHDIKEKILFLADENNYKNQEMKIRNFNFIHTYNNIAGEIIKISEKI
jgi:glycosyltransferase involved in cell wall biosynthesis